MGLLAQLSKQLRTMPLNALSNLPFSIGFACRFGMKIAKFLVFKRLAQIPCQNVSGQMGNTGSRSIDVPAVWWQGGYGSLPVSAG
jgi:hypothetical protein